MAWNSVAWILLWKKERVEADRLTPNYESHVQEDTQSSGNSKHQGQHHVSRDESLIACSGKGLAGQPQTGDLGAQLAVLAELYISSCLTWKSPYETLGV